MSTLRINAIYGFGGHSNLTNTLLWKPLPFCKGYWKVKNDNDNLEPPISKNPNQWINLFLI
jgi:hypothetical protein